MGEKLFERLKKIVEKREEVIILNEKGDDAFVVMSLDRYEDLIKETDCTCLGDSEENIEEDEFNFSLKDIDFSNQPKNLDKEERDDLNKKEMDDNVDNVDEVDEKELMERVSADIAKWRKEQEESESMLSNSSQQDEKYDEGIIIQEEKEVSSININEKDKNFFDGESLEEDEKSILTEEEKYYLEPLE